MSIVLQLALISAAYLDPLEPVASWKQSPALQAVPKLKKDVGSVNFKVVEPDFVAAVFDKNMVSAIPHTVNKKQFKQLDHD